jgi:hypothetical protein
MVEKVDKPNLQRLQYDLTSSAIDLPCIIKNPCDISYTLPCARKAYRRGEKKKLKGDGEELEGDVMTITEREG